MSLDSIRTWIMYNNQFILYTRQIKIIIFFTLHGAVVLRASAFKFTGLDDSIYKDVKYQRKQVSKYPKAEFKLGKIPYGYLLLTKNIRVEIDKEPLEIRIINNFTNALISKFSINMQESDSHPIQMSLPAEPLGNKNKIENRSRLYCSINDDNGFQCIKHQDKDVAIRKLFNNKGCLFLNKVKKLKRRDLLINKRCIKSA